MARPSSYEWILDSAENIVLESGAGQLTLDAVAKRAKVSKGGLLYNFPSKDALLEAMLKRLITRLQEARAEAKDGKPNDKLHAYISSYVNLPERDERLMAAFIAVASHNPKLLAPAHEAYKQLFEGLSSGANIKPERAAILMAAVQGFALWKMLDISFLSPAEGKRAIAELLQLSEASVGVGVPASARRRSKRGAAGGK